PSVVTRHAATDMGRGTRTARCVLLAFGLYVLPAAARTQVGDYSARCDRGALSKPDPAGMARARILAYESLSRAHAGATGGHRIGFRVGRDRARIAGEGGANPRSRRSASRRLQIARRAARCGAGRGTAWPALRDAVVCVRRWFQSPQER